MSLAKDTASAAAQMDETYSGVDEILADHLDSLAIAASASTL